MSFGKKILFGIVIMIVFCIIWVFSGINEENKDESKFYNVKIPEKLNFEKPIEFLTNKQIDSLENLVVDKDKILVIGDGYSGYDFYMWHKPSEKGKLYVKAFELTQNIQLSQSELNNRTENEITESADNYILYFGNSLIYEGTFSHYYPARFELWFKPRDSGSERKLVDKSYIIDGWDR